MINDVKVATMVLAGGKGERLYPLTQERSKPSVPFGGNFRIIDFTLMNCVMSGFRRVHVLTQYHSFSLSSHIQDRWSFLSKELGDQIETVPPKLRSPTGFYRGTADAIYQNLDILEAHRPDVVLVLSGDHVYRADYNKLLKMHFDGKADVTVLCGEVPADSASQFGVTCTDENNWIREFVEKPDDASPYANVHGVCKINLGVYCFNTKFLVQRLVEDAKKRTEHDFGKNIMPESLNIGSVLACPFPEISPDPIPYWRDVGSIDSYFQCHQDLLDNSDYYSLVDPRWPADSRLREWAPARISMGDKIEQGWSLVCGGAKIGSKARIMHSVISSQVEIGDGATIDHGIIFNGVTIGAGAKIRHAIIDKGANIPEGARIGYGNDSRRFTVSPGGIVVVVQDYRYPGTDEEEAMERLNRSVLEEVEAEEVEETESCPERINAASSKLV